jgi:tRNA modification GTPase
MQRAEQAEIRLFVFDIAHPADATGAAAWPGADTILVANKIDLVPLPGPDFSAAALSVSALTGEGIDKLLTVLGERVAQTYRIEAPVLTRARHRQALEEAAASLPANRGGPRYRYGSNSR